MPREGKLLGKDVDNNGQLPLRSARNSHQVREQSFTCLAECLVFKYRKALGAGVTWTPAICALQVSKLVSLHQGFQGSTGSPGSLSEKADLETAAPVLTEQWRRRWMGAKEDEQIEIGPMIGRGGYGKVFKGDNNNNLLHFAQVESQADLMSHACPRQAIPWPKAVQR